MTTVFSDTVVWKTKTKKPSVLGYSGPNENSVLSYRSLNTAYRVAWV